MELALALQGAQLGAAALTGAALGLFYDVLRALRRRLRRGQWLLDALFVLVCAYALVRLTLLPGRGEFRLFFLPALITGAAVYFLRPSPFVLHALEGVLAALAQVLRVLTAPLRWLLKKTKKFFYFPYISKYI